MYNEILLQNLPIVIRRKLLDFSSVQDDVIGAHSKIRFSSSPSSRQPQQTQRRNNDARGSPQSSPSRHRSKTSPLRQRIQPSSSKSDPLLGISESDLLPDDSNNTNRNNNKSPSRMQRSSRSPIRHNNNNSSPPEAFRSSSSVTDALTSMWEQELNSAKTNSGGGVGVSAFPYWLQSVNPKVEDTTRVKKLAELNNQQQNLRSKIDSNNNKNAISSNKKSSSNIFSSMASFGSENAFTNNNQNINSSSRNNNNSNTYGKPSTNSTLDSVMQGMINFPAPPCQLTLHQDYDFNRLLQATNPQLFEEKKRAERLVQQKQAAASTNMSNNNKRHPYAPSSTVSSSGFRRNDSQQSLSAFRSVSGGNFPTYSNLPPVRQPHHGRDSSSATVIMMDNDDENDDDDEDQEENYLKYLNEQERERLAELIMQHPVSLLGDEDNNNSHQEMNPLLDCFISDRDPRIFLKRIIDKQELKRKSRSSRTNSPNRQQRQQQYHHSFGTRQTSPEKANSQQMRMMMNAEYSLKPTKDKLYSDLEKCTSIMSQFLCNEGGQSTWLLGKKEPFTEPLQLSRRLLDRICASLHSMLIVKKNNNLTQNQNATDNDNDDDESHYLPHLPMALIGPSRLLLPISFADKPQHHDGSSSDQQSDEQEQINLSCEKLITFFSKCLFLGRSRKPLLGDEAAANQEVLFQLFSIGGIGAVCPLSGKSYLKQVSSATSGGGEGGSSSSTKVIAESLFSSTFGGTGSSASLSNRKRTGRKSSRVNDDDDDTSSNNSSSSSRSSASSAASSAHSRSSSVSSSYEASAAGSRGSSRRNSLQSQTSSSQQSNAKFLPSSLNHKLFGSNKKHRQYERKKKFEKTAKTSNPFSGKCDSHRVSAAAFASNQTAPPPMHFCFPNASAISDLFEGVISSFSSVPHQKRPSSSSSSFLANTDLSKLVSTEAALTCLSYLASTHSTLARVAGFRLPLLISANEEEQQQQPQNQNRNPRNNSNSSSRQNFVHPSSSKSLPYRQRQTLPTSIEAVHRSLLVAKTIMAAFSIGCRSRLGMANPSVPLLLRCEMAVERRRIFISASSTTTAYEDEDLRDYGDDNNNDEDAETDKILGISIRWVPESVDIRSVLKKVADERRPTLVPEQHINISRGEVPTLAVKPMKPLAMKLVHCQTVIAGQSLHSLFDFQEVYSSSNKDSSNLNDDDDEDPSNSVDEKSNNNNNNNNSNLSAAASCMSNGDYEEIVTEAVMNILHLAADLELASEEAKKWRTSQREILLPSSERTMSGASFNGSFDDLNQFVNQHQKITIAFCDAMRKSIFYSVKLGLSLDDETASLFVAHILDDRLSLNALRARLRSFAADIMYSLLLWLFDASSVWVPSCGSFSDENSATFKKQSSSTLKASLYKAVIRFVGTGEKNMSFPTPPDPFNNNINNQNNARRTAKAAAARTAAEKEKEDTALFGAGILDQMFEDDDVEENFSADRVLSEHDLGSLGTEEDDFEAVEEDEQQQQTSSSEEQSFLASFLKSNTNPNASSGNFADPSQQLSFAGQFFQSHGSFGSLSEQPSHPHFNRNNNNNQNQKQSSLEKLKQELLAKFHGSTSTLSRNLMPGLFTLHPLYSKMLRLPAHSSAKVFHAEQLVSASSGSGAAATKKGGKNAASMKSVLSKSSSTLDKDLISSGSWNLWSSDTRERLLISNPTTATTTFTRSPRGRLLLNSSYVSVFEQQIWKSMDVNGVSPTSSDLMPPPAVVFFVPKAVIAERAIDTEMTLSSSVIREERAKMEMLQFPDKKSKGGGDNKSSKNQSFVQEVSSIFGYPCPEIVNKKSSNINNASSSFIAVDHDRDNDLRAIQFLWRNVVGLRANAQQFFSISTFLSQFWIIVLHHNWSRCRSRTSTLLMDRIYALSTPDGKTLKKDIYSFHKRNPAIAIQWISNILSLSFSEASSSSPSFSECRSSADLVVVKKQKTSLLGDDFDKFDDEFVPSADPRMSVSVFVNGFDTFSTLGFARKQALVESCIPIINRFVFAASSLRKRWKQKEQQLLRSAATVQSFAKTLSSKNFLIDLFKRRYVEARSHEICFGHGSLLEDRRLRSVQRQSDILMNSVRRQRSVLENELGVSPYFTPPKSRRETAIDKLINSPDLEVEEITDDGTSNGGNNNGNSLQQNARDRLRGYLSKTPEKSMMRAAAAARTPPPTPSSATPRHLRPSLLQLAEAAQYETPLNPRLAAKQKRDNINNKNLFDENNNNQQQVPRSSSSPTRASGKTTQFFDKTHSSVALLGSSVAANLLEPGHTPSTVDRAFGRAFSRSVATIVTVELVERQRLLEREVAEFRRAIDSWSDLSPTLKHAKAENNSRNAIVEKWVQGFCVILDLFVEPRFREIITRSEAARRRYLRVFNHNVGMKILIQHETKERQHLERQEVRISLFLKNHSIMYAVMESMQDMLNLNTEKRTQFERQVAAAAQMKISSLMSSGGKDEKSASGSSKNLPSVQRSAGNSKIANVVRQAVQAEKEPLHVRVQRSVYLTEADCLRSILEFTPNILQAEETAREQIIKQKQNETIFTREMLARRKLEHNCFSFLLRFGLEFQLFLLPLVERDIRGSVSALGALYYSDVGKRFIIQRNELAHWEQIMKSELHERREIDREAQMWDTLFDDSYASPMRLLEMLEKDRNAVHNLMSRVQPMAREQQTAGMRNPGLLPHQQHAIPHNNSTNNNNSDYASLVASVAAARRRQQQAASTTNASRRNNNNTSANRNSLDRFLNDADGNNHEQFDDFGDDQRTSYQSYFAQQNNNNSINNRRRSPPQRRNNNNELLSANPSGSGEDDRVVFLSNRVQQANQNTFTMSSGTSAVGGTSNNDNIADDMSPNSRILRDAGAVARPSRVGMNQHQHHQDSSSSSRRRSLSRDRGGDILNVGGGKNTTHSNTRMSSNIQKRKVPLTTEQRLLQEMRGTTNRNRSGVRR